MNSAWREHCADVALRFLFAALHGRLGEGCEDVGQSEGISCAQGPFCDADAVNVGFECREELLEVVRGGEVPDAVRDDGYVVPGTCLYMCERICLHECDA